MARATLSVVAQTGRPSAKVIAPDAFRPSLQWRLGLAVLSFCLAFVWVSAATIVPGERLGEAGVAAFQAFARPGVEPVEFATSDKAEAQAWLTTRLRRPVYSPGHAHPPSNSSARGSRLILPPRPPFWSINRGTRLVGLLVQSLDAPPTTAPQLLVADGGAAAIWTWRGQGLALVGDLGRSGIAEDCGRLRRSAGGSRSAHARARLVGLLIAHLLHERGQFRIRLVRQNDP